MSDNTHLENTLFFDTNASGFGSGDLGCRGMRGREAISTCYEFEIDLECRLDGGISPGAADELLVATCQLAFGPSGIQRVSGVLRELERVEIDPDGHFSQYRAVLVPRLWLASLSRRSRVFNEKTVPDILTEVLTEMELADGTDFELRLVEDYPEREYVVQYEESDLDFMSRWMERLGMFYFFEQTDGCEKLVITDSNTELLSVTDHPECAHSGTHAAAAVGGVHHVRRIHRKMPKTQYVGDFNWRTPGQRISGEAPIDDAFGAGLVTHYGDHFKDDAEGATYAQVRAEEIALAKTTFELWSANTDFAPGFRFAITGSPMGELDMEYLITEVEHLAEPEGDVLGPSRYRNEVRAIPFATPYRAPRKTRWPRIDGVMHARIDAESVSPSAPIDDQGRYRVVIPYDLAGEFGGRATRWIRKGEPYSGPSYGMHFTLHVGAEVLLAHTGGDPDRPVIISAVPNPATASPLTRDHATRSAIRTRSGILIDFEDDA